MFIGSIGSRHTISSPLPILFLFPYIFRLTFFACLTSNIVIMHNMHNVRRFTMKYRWLIIIIRVWIIIPFVFLMYDAYNDECFCVDQTFSDAL